MKSSNYNSKEYKLNEVIKGIMVGLFLVLVLSVIVIITTNDFYYSKEKSSNVEELVIEDTSNDKYHTIIVHDNTYTGVNIKNSKDAKKLIEKDSVQQKKTCSSEVISLEKAIHKA